jgi:REP element-mobilizing transposase RayT
MQKRDYIDFQDRARPLAYLITFRTYGTWFHGEARGSVDRKNYNCYGKPSMPTNEKILIDERNVLKTRPVLLNARQRSVVESPIKRTSEIKKNKLHAVNARTNHVHAVVSCSGKPEAIMNSFKSHATRDLRRNDLLDVDVKPWARHGSTRYLWTEDDLRKAIEYVLLGQGDEPFR